MQSSATSAARSEREGPGGVTAPTEMFAGGGIDRRAYLATLSACQNRQNVERTAQNLSNGSARCSIACAN